MHLIERRYEYWMSAVRMKLRKIEYTVQSKATSVNLCYSWIDRHQFEKEGIVGALTCSIVF